MALILKSLNNFSPGWDDKNRKLLNNFFSCLLQRLCHVANLSFDKEYVPDQLKIANIVPIFKNGDASLIQKYIDLFLVCQYCQKNSKLYYIID